MHLEQVLSRRGLPGVLVAFLAAATVVLAVTPAAAVPAVSCGRLKVDGFHYSVRAHVLGCSRARAWTVRYLRHHRAPHAYVCRRFNRRITRVVFVCENPATETRTDGPQSFSASR